MQWLAWLIIALAAVAVLGRVARWLTFWAWVRSVKDPKQRMEAEILWRTYRRSGRRKRLCANTGRSWPGHWPGGQPG